MQGVARAKLNLASLPCPFNGGYSNADPFHCSSSNVINLSSHAPPPRPHPPLPPSVRLATLISVLFSRVIFSCSDANVLVIFFGCSLCFLLVVSYNFYEPAHDKTNKMACAPCENSDQPGHQPSLISLHCPDEESLDLKLPIERTANSDQTGRMPRLIWVFAGCTCHFVMRWLILLCYYLVNVRFHASKSPWKSSVFLLTDPRGCLYCGSFLFVCWLLQVCGFVLSLFVPRVFFFGAYWRLGFMIVAFPG